MQLEWYGQSAFRLADGSTTIVVDPFDVTAMSGRGMRWDYPAIDVDADVLLVTHEHVDHNGVGVVGGDPLILRSTAGRFDSPIGDVVGVASEHDRVAGTERGPNTIYVFTLGGWRVAHLGDLGQAALRPEQVDAIGPVDLLIAPVGGGPTLDAEAAHAVAATLRARVVVPMHYRTERIDFLEPVDVFVDRAAHVTRAPGSVVELGDRPSGADERRVLIPAAP